MKTLLTFAICSMSAISATASEATLLQNKIYWSNYSAGTIERSNFDGTDKQVIISGLEDPRGVDFDPHSNHLYWTDPSTSKIQRSDPDGSSITDLVDLGGDRINDVVVDRTNSKLYWTNSSTNTIQRSDLLGGNIENLVTATGNNQLAELELDIANDTMYWTEYSNGLIRSASLDGTSPQTLVSGLNNPRGLALDPVQGKMYWTELSGGSRIQKSDLDGTDIQLLFQGSDIDDPGGISLDPVAGLLYWVEPSSVRRSTIDGLNLTTIVSDTNTDYAGDLVLAFAIPEPTTATLALAVLCLVVGRRRGF